MPPIEKAVEEIVSQLPGYSPRPQQFAMARTIMDAIETGRHALIEAGTGSGKSFGYLLPVLESGKKAVISTGTIALQEQLLFKDIPFLAQAYGREIKVALAKGRSNYVCLRKLAEMDQATALTDPNRRVVDDLIQIVNSRTWNGDRADLPFNVDYRLWADSFGSDGEDCLGPKCPNWEYTPHRLARMELDDAQIIIANHALYFTDLATEAGILPKHDVVVFDEAHHLDRNAISAFSVQVTRWMGNKVLQRVQRRFSNIPARLTQAVADAETDLIDYLYARGRGQFKIDTDPQFREHARAMAKALADMAQWLATTDAGQMALLEDDPAVAKQRAEELRDQMMSVAQALAASWDHFSHILPDDRRANWMVIDPERDYYELNSAPLEVGTELTHLLWQKRSCVLTSATLAVDGKFDFLKKELGLPGDTLDQVLGSPFDFQNQALLYVPRHVPAPNDPNFLAAIVPEIEKILRMTQGRAFVLCTSYRALRELSTTLMARIPFPSRTQEDLPRARLVEWFKATPNAVLFATATFWEGIDIPGDALSCVIIDKLPFASPDDPVVQARTDQMKGRDEDWFNGYVLPKAILALKQGFGRLIRTQTDRGVVAIFDPRLLTKRYGQVVLRSLPPARRLPQLAENLDAAFAQTTRRRPAASGRYWPEEEVGYRGRYSPPPPDLDAVLGEPNPD